MIVTFELWQLITLAVALAGAFAALGRLLLAQFQRSIERSLLQLKEYHEREMRQLRADAGKWSELEREFYKHLAELPVIYIRRDDYVRGQTVIESKLDAISSEVKLVQIHRGIS